jgi:hypothetical protein
VQLVQGDKAVHVTFEGYSFFLPKDAAGRRIALEGKVLLKAIDKEKAEHMKAEGAGAAVGADVSIEAYGVELQPR